MVLALLISFGLGFAIDRYSSFSPTEPAPSPTEPAPTGTPERTPHATSPDENHAIQNKPAEERYWRKVFKPDILPVWIGAFVTLGASVIALFALGGLRGQNNMIISKERARLRVDLVQLPKEPEDFPALFVKARVTISGSTEAAIRKTTFKIMAVGTDEYPSLQPSQQEMRGMPSVIRAADAPIEVRDFIVKLDGFTTVFTGASMVYAKGAIHYTDIFDGKWVFRFSRRYKYLFYPEDKIIGGSWEDYGEEGDNGEYPDL
jgi:hypothetical protein